MSAVIAINNICGFVFHVLLGRKLGISRQLDCFFVSLLVFNIFTILTSLITALLLPVFNEIRLHNEEEGFQFADVVFKWSLLIGFFGWLVVMAAGPLIVRLFASGFDEEAVSLTAGMLKILFVGYIFFNLSLTANQILNAFFLFIVPTVAGLLIPLSNIASIFLLTPIYGIKGIAASYLFSNALVAVILIAYLFIKTGWRPTKKIYHCRLPELIKISSKAAVSSLVWGLWDVISRNIASNLGSGMISLLSYAEKIVSTLSQVLIAPISSVFYSKVSELITMLKWEEIKSLLTRTLRINVSLAIVTSVAAVVFIKPLLTVLFLNSKFSEGDIQVLFYLTMLEIAGLVIYSIETPFVRILYGTKKMNTFLFISCAGAALFYILSKVLSARFGVYGLALGAPVSRACVLALYLYFANKHLNTNFGDIIITMIKNIALAAIFLFCGLYLAGNTEGNFTIILLWGPIWAAMYAALLKYVLPEEWNILRSRGT